ncbi:MAG: hypothetical protein E6G25_09545 [Actinobacteria bacterium]|nr:MAG: hypothetical protein E6G25_09545 [Actinomycetota bacterium]
MARLAVAATAPFGADVLERLAARHEITALLTRPDAPRGRGQKTGAPPAKEAAERLGILMAGDEETGVSIIGLVEELDAGPIAAQQRFAVGIDDDAGAIFTRAAELTPDLIDAALETQQPEPQAEDGVTYAEKIGPADRELHWSRPPEELHNLIRALSPHIGARGLVEGRPAIVWRSRLSDGGLELLEVQPEGRRRMTYDEFRRGLR